MKNKEAKPIKAIDDSYEALTNRDRVVLFAKTFGMIIAYATVLLACVGALNYGVESSKHLFTIAGGFAAIVTIVNAIKAYKRYDTNKLLNR